MPHMHKRRTGVDVAPPESNRLADPQALSARKRKTERQCLNVLPFVLVADE